MRAVIVFTAVYNPKIRYFGIGAMVVGGVVSIFSVATSTSQSLKAALQGLKGKQGDRGVPRRGHQH